MRGEGESERGSDLSWLLYCRYSLGPGPYPDGLVKVGREGAGARLYVKLFTLGGGILGHSEMVCHEDL